MLLQTSQVIGWTVAGLVVILLLLVLLTGPVRRKIRWVVLFLGLFLALHFIAETLPEESAGHGFLDLCGLFLAVSAVGLGIFLIATQSRFSQAFVRPLPQIFIDIVHSFVYLIAFLVTLGAAGIKPAELFAGSALLTAVLGLSLRDTLGNLLAGLAIQAQRPFEIGDWIQFSKESNQIGQVVEINWRATKVVTRDKVEIVVPNALLAQAPIINFSRPDPVLRRTIFLHVPYDVPPLRAKQIILEAISDLPDVLNTPKPSVGTSGFDERGLQLCVNIFVADYSKRAVESTVRDRIWYALMRQGIEIPIPPRSVRVHKIGKGNAARTQKSRIARQEEGLCCVDFIRHLPEEARKQLAAQTQTQLYAEGEQIIQQGDTSNELFIIEAGEVAVMASRIGEPAVEVSRLGPGEFFGEMAALTGESRRATVRATKECTVLVLGKAALAQLFETSPELAAHVSQIVARRQAGTDAKLSEQIATPADVIATHSDRLLERIKAFFSI